MPAKVAEKPSAETKNDFKVAEPRSVERTTDKTPETIKTNPARLRELDAAITSITKAYGEGAIMRLGDEHAKLKIDVIPTGALSVDLALGVGGLPRGRVV